MKMIVMKTENQVECSPLIFSFQFVFFFFFFFFEHLTGPSCSGVGQCYVTNKTFGQNMLRNIYKYILMRSESTNSNITCFPLWDRCLAFPQMASFLFLVNGKLSQWSDWTRCDKLCEHGKERRYKTCSNPKPRCGGKNCDLSISVEEERPCVYCPGNYSAL